MNHAPTLSPAPAPADARPAAHALIATFLEHVPDHVYFKDRDSRFIALSTSMVQLFRRTTAAEVVGKTDFDFFDEAHARPAFEDEQKIIRTGEPLLDKLEKEVWPDGRVTWVHTSKLPLRNEHGAIIGTFGLSRNDAVEKGPPLGN